MKAGPSPPQALPSSLLKSMAWDPPPIISACRRPRRPPLHRPIHRDRLDRRRKAHHRAGAAPPAAAVRRDHLGRRRPKDSAGSARSATGSTGSAAWTTAHCHAAGLAALAGFGLGFEVIGSPVQNTFIA